MEVLVIAYHRLAALATAAAAADRRLVVAFLRRLAFEVVRVAVVVPSCP